MTIPGVYQLRDNVQIVVDDNKHLSSLNVRGIQILLGGKLLSTFTNQSAGETKKAIKKLNIIVAGGFDNKQKEEIVRLANQILLSLQASKTISSEHTEVLKKVFTNKTNQIANNTAKHRYLSKALVAIISLAMISAIIGSGAFLTTIGLIPAAIGIAGISTPIAIGLIAFGASTALLYIIAKAYAYKKNDSKVADVLKAVDMAIRNLYLFSNLNDTASTFSYLIPLLLLTTIFAPHTTAIALALKCAEYPTGVLFVLSGFQQLRESSIDTYSSIKNKNYFNKNWLNIATAFVAMAIGGIFILGKQTTTLGITTNFVLNFLPLIVIGITIYAVRKQLKQIEAVAGQTPKEKLKYLKDSLTLNSEELLALEQKINDYNLEDVKKWLKQKASYTNRSDSQETRKKWKEILQELMEKEATEVRLKEIKKMILRKEMQTRLNAKMEAFSGNLELKTLKSIVELITDLDSKKPTDETDRKISEVFQKVLNESQTKYKAEKGKALLNTAFVISTIVALRFPTALAKGAWQVVYPVSQAVLNTVDTGINLIPRFRTCPTAFGEEQLDINEEQRPLRPALSMA